MGSEVVICSNSAPCFNGPDPQSQVSVRRHYFITLFLLVFLLKTGPPVIHSGIKDLKVLKTTQSGFEGFIKDQFTTLPEVKDRCFATQVYCKWRYHRCSDMDFDAIWYELVLGPGTTSALFPGTPRSQTLLSERETQRPSKSTSPLFGVLLLDSRKTMLLI